MITVNLKNVDMSGKFELLEKGNYLFQITNTEEKTSKISGNHYVLVTLTEDQSGLQVKDNIVFSPNSLWRVKSFLCAANQPYDEDNLQVNHTDWRGERVYCKVDIEEYKGTDGNQYKKNKILFYNKVEITTGAPKAEAKKADAIDDDVPF